MHEEIPISVAIKNANEANELAEKFVNKNRVLKDTQSVGGFKMSQDNLKKRENRPDFNSSNANYNPYGEGSYNNFDSTNYKTGSEQGKFYNSNMNSTSK